MARILYGIHGTGHGHAMRGLILARALPQHEFLFIANDDAPAVLEPEFRVERLPNLGTVFKNYKADIPATISRALPVLARRKKYIKSALKIVEDFQPDVCMTDLEYFVPRAAQLAGIPCLTLDHQHVLTSCIHNLPHDLKAEVWLQGLTPRYLFSPTEANIIISFYSAPVRPVLNARVMPPILRQKTLDLEPGDQGHILVYQSNSRDHRLIEFLQNSTKRIAHVFGYTDEDGQTGNIIFHKRDEDMFNNLLAGCSYVIQGGSHTLMSEALYLGKPIISIPLVALVEQRLNALYLQRLGYGRATSMDCLMQGLLDDFEAQIPFFKQNIRKASFCANQEVFKIIDEFASTGVIPNFKNTLPEAQDKM